MAAVRGCDNVPREDSTKWIMRYYRACILKAHCGDARKASSFMVWPTFGTEFEMRTKEMFSSIDHYPVHFLMHLMLAAEIVGYKCPDSIIRDQWSWFYLQLVHKLHLRTESESMLDLRLNADEQTFREQQQDQ